MLRLWQLYLSGHLPDAGGAMDQAAVMIDAFAAMSAAKMELEKQHDATTGGGTR